jgi:hypothetical protein
MPAWAAAKRLGILTEGVLSASLLRGIIRAAPIRELLTD